VVNKHLQPSNAVPGPGAVRSPGVPRIDVRDILGERGEAVIVHAGREYRLRLTSNGKLILTA